ncbi:hypothetical protein ACN20G_24555 [Streptomyces sp. BI20]|uniref:hypothetical protein n=1 Tax=Streptomyces sp. BI20 TaxID=3403460 RepID=UPI003C756AD1
MKPDPSDPARPSEFEGDDRVLNPDIPEHPAAVETLLWTAATTRPLEEVADLVGLLKRTGALPEATETALRAAAVARPLDEVRHLVALLRVPPHDPSEVDAALRAAAVGRSLEDVAALVGILTDDADPACGAAPLAPEHPALAHGVPTPGPVASGRPHPGAADPTGGPDPAPWTGPVPRVAADPLAAPRPWPPAPPAGAPAAAAPPRPAAPARPRERPADRPGRVADGVLRWFGAALLTACGLLHLPAVAQSIPGGGTSAVILPTVTVLCVALGGWLAVRGGSPRAWLTVAATALAVLALHGLASFGALDPLPATLGGVFAWPAAAAVAVWAALGLLVPAVRRGDEFRPEPAARRPEDRVLRG